MFSVIFFADRSKVINDPTAEATGETKFKAF